MRKHWLLLRAMILKEARITMRERHQLVGLVITILVLGSTVGALTHKLGPAMRASTQQPAATQPTTLPSQAAPPHDSPTDRQATAIRMAIRWVSILAATGVSVFFSMGYVMAATLATFAGEKDTKTLEILLVSPVSDTTLFLGKCLSVLLPSWSIGYLLLLFPASVGAILLREELRQAPVAVIPYALVLSIPVMLLIEASLVAIGAAISAKAETLKGASQVFGVVFLVIFLGGSYGLPLLIRETGLSQPLREFGKAWIQMPFVAQYLIFLGALAVPALVFLLIGRSLFQRDRLLT